MSAGSPMTPVGLVLTARQCPKCHAITDRVSHCFVKGPPLFPQLDASTRTVPVYVQVVERAGDVA